MDEWDKLNHIETERTLFMTFNSHTMRYEHIHITPSTCSVVPLVNGNTCPRKIKKSREVHTSGPHGVPCYGVLPNCIVQTGRMC